MWYQFFKYTLFAPGTRLVCRPWVVGEENIPTDGGAILASNHLSAADHIFMPIAVQRRLHEQNRKMIIVPVKIEEDDTPSNTTRVPVH